jgi:hypothetical protein
VSKRQSTKERFSTLVDRLRTTRDRHERERIKKELAKITFGKCMRTRYRLLVLSAALGFGETKLDVD